MHFSYRCIYQNGKVESGTLAADSLLNAERELNARGLRVLKLKQTDKPHASQRSKKLSMKTQANLYQDITILLDANMTIDAALSALEAGMNDKKLKHIIHSLSEKVTAGSSLSNAMHDTGNFPSEVIALIESGEAAGHLKVVFNALADDYKARLKLREELTSSLAYPAFLVLVAIAAVLIITFSLVPALMPIFENAQASPPFILSRLDHFHRLLVDNGLILLAVIAAILLALSLSSSRVVLKQVSAWAASHMPIIGGVNTDLSNAKFLASLSLQLTHGVQINKAVKQASMVFSAGAMRNKMLRVNESLTEGLRLAEALNQHNAASAEIIAMIAVGDEANQLPIITAKASDMLRARAMKNINRCLGVMTPAITILLGIVIGALIISVMTTLLSVNELAL